MEDKKAFKILFFLFAVISFCCAFLLYGTNAMVNEYKFAYIECMEAYNMAEAGRLPLWDGSNLNFVNEVKNDNTTTKNGS